MGTGERSTTTAPQTTWSGSSVSTGAAAAGCLESEGSTRAPRAQSEHPMPMAIRNTSASTTPTTTGHSLPLLCFFFFDPPWSPVVSSVGAGLAGGTYCVASSSDSVSGSSRFVHARYCQRQQQKLGHPLVVVDLRTRPITTLPLRSADLKAEHTCEVVSEAQLRNQKLPSISYEREFKFG